MNNHTPCYEVLLIINSQLGEHCNELEAVIHEQELQIDELFRASTMYRELYMELRYNKQ